MRLILFLAALARAGSVELVPPLTAPLGPPPVIAQLRLDLAAATLGPAPLLPAAAVSLAPDAAPAAVLAAAAAVPVAAPSAVPVAAGAVPARAPVATDAVARLSAAREILGSFDPKTFAELPADKQDAALAALWDGWKSRGLLDGGSDSDRLIVEGVDDKVLTRSNKSVFLGVGVLGYPLEDALWLSRTRISDALEENSLVYPTGQRWRNESGTPEFLGRSRRAQPLVDAWGAATAYAAEIVRQVERGSRELPKGAAASPAAAADFARVVADLVRAGDAEALAYLRDGTDPTFAAFLLDARKPGYYLYNGDKSVVARIMATAAARSLGIRRVDRPDGLVASTYFYRPARVVERLREASTEDPGEGGDDGARARLSAYAARLAAAAPSAPAASVEGWSFVAPEFLPGSALDSAANRFASGGAAQGRLELPLPLRALRARMKSGERYPQLTAERWEALRFLLEKVPALSAAGDEVVVRFAAASFQSGGKLVAPTRGGGVTLQVAALDRVAALRAGDAAELERELRFLRAAFDAALSGN